MNFKRFIEISKALRDGNDIRSHHVTFILRNNQLLSIGINKRKTHPKNIQIKYLNARGENYSDQSFIHSELDAVISLGRRDCSDLTFVNVRIDLNDMVNMAKPCSGCQNLLNQIGFKKLYYSTHLGDFIEF